MVGRGASLDGRLFLGGTDGSNPSPSSEESGESPVARPDQLGALRRNHSAMACQLETGGLLQSR
jgi:hypothetical protein